jgi:ferredoxin
MKLTVDRSRCEGHAVCALEAPELFDLDDAGDLVILEAHPPEAQRAVAQNAVDACPTQALSVSS